MMESLKPLVVLAGFAADTAALARKLSGVPVAVKIVNETAEEGDIPRAADTVVYVFSRDTSYSTQLRGVFSYVHDRVPAGREYKVALEDIDLRRASFPELSRVRIVSPEYLSRKLQRTAKKSAPPSS